MGYLATPIDIVPGLHPSGRSARRCHFVLSASVDRYSTSTEPGPIDRCRRRGAISAPAIWLRGWNRAARRSHACAIQARGGGTDTASSGARPGLGVGETAGPGRGSAFTPDVGAHARPLLGDETSRLPPHDRGALAIEVDEQERSPPRRAHSRNARHAPGPTRRSPGDTGAVAWRLQFRVVGWRDRRLRRLPVWSLRCDRPHVSDCATPSGGRPHRRRLAERTGCTPGGACEPLELPVVVARASAGSADSHVWAARVADPHARAIKPAPADPSCRRTTTTESHAHRTHCWHDNARPPLQCGGKRVPTCR